MLYIRADGNTEIGMGHVMRCLSVADAAADIAADKPVFITADEGCRAMIADRGYRVVVLGTDYRDMMGELSLLAGMVQGEHDVLLVDSYQVSRAYYLELQKLARVACFEDMGQAYPVDLLINYNIYAPDLAQGYGIREGGTADNFPRSVLLGTAYTPLRRAFQEPSEYAVNDKITNVLITTGGSDPYFAAGAIVEALRGDRALAGLHLHLVSGPFNRYAGELRRRYQAGGAQGDIAITIHENVRDMRSLLLCSDVVITAAGSTVYEVCSLGVPMIVFYFAENQRQGAEALGALTDVVNAGCFAAEGAAVADRVRETLRRCARDRAYRELLSRQERVLVDGKGAARIAGRLAALAAEPRTGMRRDT